MRPPAITIRLELEAPPHVLADLLDDAEEARIDHWLLTHPEYRELVARALELEAERRPA